MVFNFHLLVASLRHATITAGPLPPPPRGFFPSLNKAVRFDLPPRSLADALAASRRAPRLTAAALDAGQRGSVRISSRKLISLERNRECLFVYKLPLDTHTHTPPEAARRARLGPTLPGLFGWFEKRGRKKKEEEEEEDEKTRQHVSTCFLFRVFFRAAEDQTRLR